jgi:hypothetical protein
MNRCVPTRPSARRLALAALLAFAAAVPAGAQTLQRKFPITALRGTLVFANPPAVTLNGNAAQLSPGARIHGFDNMMLVTGAVAGDGRSYVVDYRIEGTGLVSEVWLLTAQEAQASPWPRTPAETAAWQFDFMSQTWTKP